MPEKKYLAKFRKGFGAMEMHAIDFYREGGKLIKHEWAMGGETKGTVKVVPDNIPGYDKLSITE